MMISCMNTKEAKSYVAASRLMHVFFILTIINSLIGIFGLSVFIAQRNRKAIGIRKVFGANIIGIMIRYIKRPDHADTFCNSSCITHILS